MNTIITVLSTIILAVTVLTLFLGILAYIVYKLRGRSTRRRVQFESALDKEKSVDKIKSILTEQQTPILNTPPSETVGKASQLIRRYEPEKRSKKVAEWK